MCIPQALAHKTLVLLLGVDPSKQLDHPLPTAHPHVTYAYMKYMWKSTRKVYTSGALENKGFPSQCPWEVFPFMFSQVQILSACMCKNERGLQYLEEAIH